MTKGKIENINLKTLFKPVQQVNWFLYIEGRWSVAIIYFTFAAKLCYKQIKRHIEKIIKINI
jgi:DNA-binding HxlR family transcriptional regulator